jgi:hypothetical protein
MKCYSLCSHAREQREKKERIWGSANLKLGTSRERPSQDEKRRRKVVKSMKRMLVILVVMICGSTAGAQYPYYSWYEPDVYRPYYYGSIYYPYSYRTYGYYPRPAVVVTKTTTTVERIYIDTWHPGEYHAFTYGSHRWNVLRTTHCITPGYVCRPGYLRITKTWYDHDLGYTYMMCPCGRVFYAETIYRW